MSESERSLDYVRNAIESLPQVLAEVCETPSPAVASPPETVITTGIGASEGAARLMASVLLERGVCARFCPLSRFVNDPPSADLLVAFSQGLSPNAQLVLAGAADFRTRWLVTSVEASETRADKRAAREAFLARGFVPICIPPRSERGTLVRLVGPTAAALLGLRLAAALLHDDALQRRLAEAPRAYHACAHAHGPLPTPERTALLAVDLPVEQLHAHRWKLLEALLGCDPPCWDVLQFAHGPLQATHDHRWTFLALTRGPDALLPRLEQTLRPGRHTLLRLCAKAHDVLGFFEHAAQIDQIVLASLEAHPRDLFSWPAQDSDRPLYGLGAKEVP